LYYYLKNIGIRNLGYARHYKLLKEIKIPIPPLAEQKQIVKKLDQLSQQTQELTKIYQQKTKNIVELQNSILQQAFNGEL
jgi:type I restriction enzyme S subunit